MLPAHNRAEFGLKVSRRAYARCLHIYSTPSCGRRSPLSIQLGLPDSRKIENLGGSVVIATGGLGTYGHGARDRLKQIVTADMRLDQILVEAQNVFGAVYSESLVEHPGHNVPLTCILAGSDPVTRRGFICALGSRDAFSPFWVRPGQPYFAGSKTFLLQRHATE